MNEQRSEYQVSSVDERRSEGGGGTEICKRLAGGGAKHKGIYEWLGGRMTNLIRTRTRQPWDLGVLGKAGFLPCLSASPVCLANRHFIWGIIQKHIGKSKYLAA